MLEFELLAQQADVAGQWGIQTHVCAQVSGVIGVHLFFCQLRVCLLSYRHHVSVSSSVTCPVDARQEGTQNLT